jgi:hypothetical protein
VTKDQSDEPPLGQISFARRRMSTGGVGHQHEANTDAWLEARYGVVATHAGIRSARRSGVPGPVTTRSASITVVPVTTPAALGVLHRPQSGVHPRRLPLASEVRTFNGSLAGGRVVMEGQKGIRIVALDEIDGGKVTAIRHMHVFDVSQIDERTARAPA